MPKKAKEIQTWWTLFKQTSLMLIDELGFLFFKYIFQKMLKNLSGSFDHGIGLHFMKSLCKGERMDVAGNLLTRFYKLGCS